MKALILLLLAMLVQSQNINSTLKENLQSLHDHDSTEIFQDLKNITLKKLPEYEDHAEMQMETTNKSQDPLMPPTPSPKPIQDVTTERELVENESTTNPEIVNTLEPLDAEADIEDESLSTVSSSTKKSTVVGKKGVENIKPSSSTKKPTVVGKKGVGHEKKVVGKKGVEIVKPKVVGKKGVEIKKPSVYARKGAGEMEDPSNLPQTDVDLKLPLDSNDTVTKNNTSDNADSVPVKVTSNIDLNDKTGTSNKSKPTSLNMLTTDEKQKNPTQLTEANMNYDVSSKPKSEIEVTTSPAINPVDSENEKPPIEYTTTEDGSTIHSKPKTASDAFGGIVLISKTENISYTPAVIGIVLLVSIIVTLIVIGYRRLQDVWLRRHYARMDFLVDGMYDI